MPVRSRPTDLEVLGVKLYWMNLLKGFTFNRWPSDHAMRREDMRRRLELAEQRTINHARWVLSDD